MNKLIIYEYINKLGKEDIINFGLNQGINLSQNEIDIIYYYIKNEYARMIDNPIEVINEIKDKVSKPVYDKIQELYNKYKNIINKIR